MITSTSAALGETRLHILHDPNRGRAVAAFQHAGLSLCEIADALNCSQPVLRNLLLTLAQDHSRILIVNPNPRQERHSSRDDHGVLASRSSRTWKDMAREQERLADHLGAEVLRWLRASTLTDAERLGIIRAAESHLDQAPLDARGQYAFSAERTIAEVLSLWKPTGTVRLNESLTTLIGRWLASWLRFWITDPQVCGKTLDLVSAVLDRAAPPQAA